MSDELKELATRINDAMRRHAQSHVNSNSPYNFYCNPTCVSDHLQVVVEREVKPLQDIKEVVSAKFPGWDGSADHLKLLLDKILMLPT